MIYDKRRSRLLTGMLTVLLMVTQIGNAVYAAESVSDDSVLLSQQEPAEGSEGVNLSYREADDTLADDTAADSADTDGSEVADEDTSEADFSYDYESYGTVTADNGIVDEGAVTANDNRINRMLSSDPEPVWLDITGTYYTGSAADILRQINAIRYEACKEGIIDKDTGKPLTLEDYVPLKWSNDLEQSVRLRAMEAGLTVAHATLCDSIGIFSRIDGDKFNYLGENLAWNNNHDASGIAYGINQFYEEKQDWINESVKGKSTGVTGHYTNMINPSFTHVGVAACHMSEAPNGWICIAMQLGGKSAWYDGEVDETKISGTGSITNTLPVNASCVQSMTLDGSSTVKKGGTADYRIKGSIRVSNGYGGSTKAYTIPAGNEGVTWTSSDEEVLTVSQGRVSGIKGGKVTLTAGVGSRTASKSVTVTQPLESIVLSDTTLNINRNETTGGQLTVSYYPEEATDTKAVTWKSSNTGLVTIDSKGCYTVKKPGTATLTATAKTTDPEHPTLTAECVVNITAPVTDMKLNKESAVLSYTGTAAPTLQLKTVFTPADTDESPEISWSSSDESVAVVDGDGRVTAVAGGTAIITAATATHSAQCKVTVSAPLKSLDVSDTAKTIYLPAESGEISVSLTPSYTSQKQVTFTSSDPSVIKVSGDDGVAKESAVVTATNGSAQVTLHRIADVNANTHIVVTTENKSVKRDIPVTVAVPVTRADILSGSTVLTDSLQQMDMGGVMELTAAITPDDAYDSSVVWSSSDTSVVSVDRDGMLIAEGEGDAAITATANGAPSSVTASFKVHVSFRASGVELSRSEVTMYEGDSYTLRAGVRPEGVAGSPVFASSDETVAKVDSSSGVITAMNAGETVITVSIDGKTDSCRVRVIRSDTNAGDEPYGNDDKSGIWMAAASFNDSMEYTGKAVTQSPRVYYGRTLLKEKTDYTLSYKNNINAGEASSLKAPRMTVTLKGQYQGCKTYYYSITPVNIADNTLIHETGTKTAVRNNKDQKLVPDLYFGETKLKNKTQYICSYPEADYSETGLHKVVLQGVGNFTGSRETYIAVTEPDMDISKTSVTVKSADPGESKIYYGRDIETTVKIGSTVIPSEYLTVDADTTGVGSRIVTVRPSDAGTAKGYYGYKQVKIKVYADRAMKDVTPDGFNDSITYNRTYVISDGGMLQRGVRLYYGADKLGEGTDYTVKYSGITRSGTATVIYKGIGRYTGSLRKTYKIIPCTAGITPEYASQTAYTKGGVMPDIRVKDADGNYLTPKKDYTVSVLARSNLKPGEMKCEVKGVGDYKGYSSGTVSIDILNGNLAATTVSVADKQYSANRSSWKSAVKLTDTNGKVLKAGTDYEKELRYSYAGSDSTQYPVAGTVVYVTAIGKGAYKGSSVTASYRIFSRNISTLTVKIDPMTYTGTETEPGSADIHVYLSAKDAKSGSGELGDSVYTIIGYSNNIKAGNGRVTLRGLGDYGGLRTCTYKIVKKEYDRSKKVTGVTMDKKTAELSLKSGEDTLQLTAAVGPDDAYNKTLIWSSSNTKVATVDQTGMVRAVGEGRANITALTQDSSKKAVCSLTVYERKD